MNLNDAECTIECTKCMNDACICNQKDKFKSHCNCAYNKPCKEHPEVYSGPDGEDGPWAPGWEERNRFTVKEKTKP